MSRILPLRSPVETFDVHPSGSLARSTTPVASTEPTLPADGEG